MPTDDATPKSDRPLPRGRARFEEIPSRRSWLGRLEIRRALPVRERRLIGPWCFLDRYGPLSFSEGQPMDVAAHPHIGIQTVSWLLDGEVEHFDSLGCEAIARPGGVNVMTSGRGIAHAEQTPRENAGRLDGVQLWVALPDEHRNVDPSFQHVAEVPSLDLRGGEGRLFIGTLVGTTSPANRYSDLVGAELTCRAGGEISIPLDPRFEHGLFVATGEAQSGDDRLALNSLYYLGAGRSEIDLRSRDGARLLLLGGLPFPVPILMWWNFVARSSAEIAAARNDWEAGRHFGDVHGHRGPRIPAPSLIHPSRPVAAR